jgi:O-antigen ligase
VVSFGFGQVQWYLSPSASIFAQIAGLLIFVLSVGAFLLVAHQTNNLEALKWMSFTFVALAGIYLFGRLIPWLGWRISPIYQRAGNESGFWVWLVIISFSQAVYNRDLKFRWRVILFAILLITLYVILIQARAWTSGWLPPLIGIVVILWMSSSKKLRWAILITGLILVFFYNIVQSFVMTGDNAFSLVTRLEAWRIIAQLIRVSPIFGLGFANYYWYTPLIPIMGYSVVFNSHNNYVDLIAQTGLMGLLMFLWFVFEIGLNGWRLRDRVPKGFAQAYVYGAMGGLAALLVSAMLGDWMLPFVYNIGLEGFRASVLGWLFLGGLVALEKMYPTVENKD